MDSAGGTVSQGRNRSFQAVYKLRGKVLNTHGMEIHVARKNKEVDDLISILRCGTGAALDISQCKFNKVITLADADDDGKHIELLLLTMGAEFLYALIEAGMFYIALSPLYKVTIPGKPVAYLNTTDDLTKFFASQIGITYDFIDSSTGKPVTNEKKKAKFVGNVIKYQKAVNAYADKLNITPHILETTLLRTYDPETGDLELGERVDTLELANGNITLLGFHSNGSEENFMCVTGEPSELLTNIASLHEMLVDAVEYELVPKKGKLTEVSTIEMIDEIFDKIKKGCRVSRQKGLGESNPEDLRETTLSPEKRRLIRVMPADDYKDTVNRFMGKNPETRKEFLKEVFAEAIKDAMEV